jgi:WD40-like Beta Propeller Repeat
MGTGRAGPGYVKDVGMRTRVGQAMTALATLGFACSPSPPSPTTKPTPPTSPVVQSPALSTEADLPGWFAYTDADSNIWIIAGDGTGRRQLTDSGSGYDFAPSWSPDGRRLVFRSSRGEPPVPEATDIQIFVIDVDGEGER